MRERGMSPIQVVYLLAVAWNDISDISRGDMAPVPFSVAQEFAAMYASFIFRPQMEWRRQPRCRGVALSNCQGDSWVVALKIAVSSNRPEFFKL